MSDPLMEVNETLTMYSFGVQRELKSVVFCGLQTHGLMDS